MMNADIIQLKGLEYGNTKINQINQLKVDFEHPRTTPLDVLKLYKNSILVHVMS